MIYRQQRLIDRIGGIAEVERLCQIQRDSWPSGTEYDRLMGCSWAHTSEENFVLFAKKKGFTNKQISLFKLLD